MTETATAGAGARWACSAGGPAVSHHHALPAAAWLEGTGTLLYVIFVLALVHLAGPGPAWRGGSPHWRRPRCSPSAWSTTSC